MNECLVLWARVMSANVGQWVDAVFKAVRLLPGQTGRCARSVFAGHRISHNHMLNQQVLVATLTPPRSGTVGSPTFTLILNKEL